MVDGKSEACHAAHGQAEKVCLLDPIMVHETQHIAGQMLERVGAFGRRAPSVPARVIAKDAKILGQERELMIPAAGVRGEAVRKDDPGAALLAVDIGRDIDAAD